MTPNKFPTPTSGTTNVAFISRRSTLTGIGVTRVVDGFLCLRSGAYTYRSTSIAGSAATVSLREFDASNADSVGTTIATNAHLGLGNIDVTVNLTKNTAYVVEFENTGGGTDTINAQMLTSNDTSVTPLIPCTLTPFTSS